MGLNASGRRQVTEDLRAVDDRACTVLHVDMDAFFAHVELLRRPELARRPMMVAATEGRSVVLSANYSARDHGVRSGMPSAQAAKLCPRLVIVPPDHRRYREVSQQLMRLLADLTPRIEPISVDEAFLDVSGARRTGGRPANIAVELRRRIAAELGLTATVGAAATKFVAKLASSLAKPDGVLIVPPEQVVGLLHPLPVRALWGVGPAMAKTLLALGLQTVGDIAVADRDWLVRRLGQASGTKLHELAWGRDDRSVSGPVAEQSVGSETTFDSDTDDLTQLRRTVLSLADRTGRRARRSGQRGRTVALKVRFDDFTTITRSITFDGATDSGRDIHAAATRLLLSILTPSQQFPGGRQVRLVGVRLENLSGDDDSQLTFDEVLTPDRTRWQAAEGTVDRVAAKFGDAAIRPASVLPPPTTSPAPLRRKPDQRRGDLPSG